jgi:hypothetical protein
LRCQAEFRWGNAQFSIVETAMTNLAEDAYRPETVSAGAARLIILSGCSGGGKSALLVELGRRGFATYEEAGRQS